MAAVLKRCTSDSMLALLRHSETARLKRASGFTIEKTYRENLLISTIILNFILLKKPLAFIVKVIYIS